MSQQTVSKTDLEWLAAADFWFAWRPVRLVDGHIAWWRIVKRRRIVNIPSGHGGVSAAWTEYSRLQVSTIHRRTDGVT